MEFRTETCNESDGVHRRPWEVEFRTETCNDSDGVHRRSWEVEVHILVFLVPMGGGGGGGDGGDGGVVPSE